jgi:integrase
MALKIHKRGGIWHYRGTVAGHRLRGSTRTEDRKEATRVASEIQNRQHQRGVDAVEQALTFPKAVSLYLAAGKPDRYIDRLEDYWKNTKVTDINSGAIKQSAMALYPNAKGSTRNRQVIVPTQAIINHCAELQLCQPIKIARFKFETKIKRPVTLEWVNDFRAHADRLDVGVLALFMFATGARIQEALAVQWDDIDMRKRTVLIRQTKLGNERLAHLPQDLFIAIANLPRRNEPKLAKPFAFAGHSSALAAWGRAVKAAGIAPLTFHSCRHGFATALLHRGVDVITIAKLGGWKSAAHVLKTYGHAQDDKTLTDRIFDTEIDTAEINRSNAKGLG